MLNKVCQQNVISFNDDTVKMKKTLSLWLESKSEKVGVEISCGRPNIYSVILVSRVRRSRKILFKGVPGNMVNRDQNTSDFEFILIRLCESSWR